MPEPIEFSQCLYELWSKLQIFNLSRDKLGLKIFSLIWDIYLVYRSVSVSKLPDVWDIMDAMF